MSKKEWLLFVPDQLEVELNRTQFEKVENDRLYLKQDENLSLWVNQSQMISEKQMPVDIG